LIGLQVLQETKLHIFDSAECKKRAEEQGKVVLLCYVGKKNLKRKKKTISKFGGWGGGGNFVFPGKKCKWRHFSGT
jgi:hypothetical protein